MLLVGEGCKEGHADGELLSRTVSSGYLFNPKFNPEPTFPRRVCYSLHRKRLWTNEHNSRSELASLGRRAHQQNDKFRIFEDIWSAMLQYVIDRVTDGGKPVFPPSMPLPQPGPVSGPDSSR